MSDFEEKKVVLFDMDNTLVLKDTGDLWGKFLEKKGLVTQADIQKRLKLNADYAVGRLDAVENFEFEISLLKKISLADRERWRVEFFEHHVKPHVSHEGLTLIKEYKADKNTTVILITATLSYVAMPVAKYSGVHDLIATEAEQKGENYTGRVSGIPCLQEGKIDRFKLWLKEKNIVPFHTILYSDSINDLPLLNFVKEPIAVTPDKYLRKIAEEKKWKIINFK